MDTRTTAYLQAMGIDVWVARDGAPVPATELAAPEVEDRYGETPPVQAAATADWETLEAGVIACQACELHATRTRAVFGVGNRQARWLVIGEAPGVDEDRQGEPFVGRAGQLLNAMLKAIGLSREQVYIANILKCRPPGNRDPRAEEVLSCQPYLQRQIELIRPGVILAVGRIAAQDLLNSTVAIGHLRGRVHRHPQYDIPLVVTYHPAYLLRTPTQKAKAWQDLKLARGVVAEP